MDENSSKPFQFRLGSLMALTAVVALLTWLGTTFPIVGFPIISGILFALIPCILALVVAGAIKAIIYVAKCVMDR